MKQNNRENGNISSQSGMDILGGVVEIMSDSWKVTTFSTLFVLFLAIKGLYVPEKVTAFTGIYMEMFDFVVATIGAIHKALLNKNNEKLNIRKLSDENEKRELKCMLLLQTLLNVTTMIILGKAWHVALSELFTLVYYHYSSLLIVFISIKGSRLLVPLIEKGYRFIVVLLFIRSIGTDKWRSSSKSNVRMSKKRSFATCGGFGYRIRLSSLLSINHTKPFIGGFFVYR